MSVCLSVCVSVCVYVPNTLGQPGGFKNGRIWLKFCTLVPWVNTWGCFFIFLKILIFGAWGTSFSAKTRLKLLGRLQRLQKCSDLTEILHTCSLGEYLVVSLFIF